MKECVLAERICTGCGDCDRCDLNPEKVCDNCCACIDAMKVDYASIPVTIEEKPPTSPKMQPRKRTRN